MTIASETAIYNLALNAIGARDNISSPSESSREAEVCNLWYPIVRDQIFAAAAWPEATKTDYLSLVAEADDSWQFGAPLAGFSFAYSTPIDLLRPQYLSDFSQFRVTTGTSNRVFIHANAAQAVLTYTFRNEAVAMWSAELQMAVVYGLAANICMPLTGKTQKANLMLAKANEVLQQARESSSNWNSEMFETLPEWLQMRGYSSVSQPRYVYPFGGLLLVNS